jgi:hypothetical protein
MLLLANGRWATAYVAGNRKKESNIYPDRKRAI